MDDGPMATKLKPAESKRDTSASATTPAAPRLDYPEGGVIHMTVQRNGETTEVEVTVIPATNTYDAVVAAPNVTHQPGDTIALNEDEAEHAYQVFKSQ